MEKTGITRRIDELGRIVIPKEIRKNLKIQSSDELEIKVMDNDIVLSKYDGLESDKIIHTLLVSLYKMTGNNILFTSKDKIIDAKGKSVNSSFSLTSNVINIIHKRVNWESNSEVNLFNQGIDYYAGIYPLVINGDLMGSIIMYSEKMFKEIDRNILLFCQRFLENYLE